MEPFDMPVCTPCDHTFCRECIESWLDKDTKLCPTCRVSLNLNSLTPASRIICNKIDRYLVKCLACDQTNIPRGQFNDHCQKLCAKIDVPCRGADLQCPWKGSRDDLQRHLSICAYEQMRPVLNDLRTTNALLNEENNKHQNQIEHLTAELENMREEFIQVSNQLQRLRECKFHTDLFDFLSRYIYFEGIQGCYLKQK